jgi:uncharacterized protein
MQHRRLHEQGGQRTLVVVLETGEEVMSCLQRFVSEHDICAAQLTAIGAFSDAVLMYFDWAQKDMSAIPVREQIEVASLLGDVAEAGHRNQAHARPTLEIMVTENPAHLRKFQDPESGSALIKAAA